VSDDDQETQDLLPRPKPDNWRVRQGHRARAQGEAFESYFRLHCRRTGVHATPFPLGAKRVGPFKLIQIRTPFDWICSFQGKSSMIDTKSCEGKAFGFGMIEPHQVLELLAHERQGVQSGYVVWLREIDRIIFIPASLLDRAFHRREKGSFTPDTPGVILLGSSKDLNPRLIWTPPHTSSPPAKP
jgi:hypothetical protein